MTKYFITYVYGAKNGGWGFGSAATIIKDGKMNVENIQDFTEDMKKQLETEDVVVINWNKLDD